MVYTVHPSSMLPSSLYIAPGNGSELVVPLRRVVSELVYVWLWCSHSMGIRELLSHACHGH
jgi:hypothetical protein